MRRRLLRSVAVVWLACHLAAVCVAAVAACCPPAHHEDKQTECCPGVGPGQGCPMHHTTQGKPQCGMRSTRRPTHAALLSLSPGIGLVPHFSTTLVTMQSLDTVRATTPSALARAERPDSPPPRS